MSGAVLLAVVVVVALASSFLLSGMEAGFMALNRPRVRHLDRRGVKSARILCGFMRNPESFLWTILVGNTLANVILLGIAFHGLLAHLRGSRLALLASLAVTAFLLFMLADLLPKMLFRRFPTRLCLGLARPFSLMHLLLRPAVRVIEKLAALVLVLTGGRQYSGRLFGGRDELRQMLQDSAQSLTRDEQTMVARVLDLQSVTVGSLAVPLSRVLCVRADEPLAEVYRLCRESGHDRLPVRRPDGGGIAGLVTLRGTLYREAPRADERVADRMQPAIYLEERVSLEAALKQFRRGGQRLAVVLDGRRREVGIITLTDILRFVFGEVPR